MPEDPPRRRSLPLRILHFLAFWSTVLYVAGLAFLLPAIALVGERYAVLNLGLFVPPLAWLLPLVLLAPLSLLVRPRLLLWHLLCIAGVVGLFMRPQWNAPDLSTEPDLICITNNIAQNHKLNPAPFIRQSGAHVVALQDSYPEAGIVLAALPDWQKAGVDQFVLLSQYPIGNKSAITLPEHRGPVAARFEVAHPKGLIAIYNVRMPTPRSDLRHVRYWLGNVRRDPTEIRDRTYWDEYAESLPPRIALLRGLCARVQQETLPYLVMGDFNTPSIGYGHRLLTEQLTDCFVAAGRGYGLTFPGDFSHRGMPVPPWLRLDYIFTGPGWETLYCEAERDRASEHRAVVAGLRRGAK